MSRNYLITGGAGFVGATLVRALLARGDAVTVVDSGQAAGYDAVTGIGAEIVRADIGDLTAVDAAVARCTAIVHLAAQVSVPASVEDPLFDMTVNVEGSLRLLEAARRHGVTRFVFASSNAVVGGHGPPAHEELVPFPVSPYGAAKAAIEAYLRAYGDAYGIEGVALRFANAYGPWSEHKQSVMAAFIKAYLDDGPLVINGTGEQTRDFVHVQDVAEMVIRCLDAPPELVAGQIFQVGTGAETSLLELARLLFEAGGGEVPIQHRPPSAGDVPRNVSDVSKAARILGWTPRVALAQGMADMLEWFRGRRRD